MLYKNKNAFDYDNDQNVLLNNKTYGIYNKLYNNIKAIQSNFTYQMTDEQNNYLLNLLNRIYDKSIPYNTIKKYYKNLENLAVMQQILK